MTKYTKQERKKIAAAFRAAKPHLWDGRSRGDTTYFICVALLIAAENNRISHSSYIMAKEVINYRLDKFSSVVSWLRCQGIDVSDIVEVQTYRHRWLDALIAEFSA